MKFDPDIPKHKHGIHINACTERHTHTKGVSHLEGLEAEPNVVSLRYSDPPHTLFGGSVVIRIIGRLNLPRVLGDFPSTDRCTREDERREKGWVCISTD